MKLQLQFAGCLMGFTLSGALAVPCVAQGGRFGAQQKQERRQDRPQPKQQRQERQKENANRPPRNAERPPANANRPQTYANRTPDRLNDAGPRNVPHENLTPRQQPGAGTQGQWIRQMRSLTPTQRERYFQNSPAFRGLSPEKQNSIRQQFNRWDRMTPQQKADQREKEETWSRLTPEQRDHIKNDVYPQYQQMPRDRQQAIKQRLSVLQNMPESARNQRLNDPNFTRGMSEEDKAMLRDLSHMHIGAPDPPSE